MHPLESINNMACVCIFSHAQLFVTDSMAPLSMGFPRQEHWSGLPFPSPRDLPDLGIEAMSPALAGGFFTTEPPGKPKFIKSTKDTDSLFRLDTSPVSV